MNNDKLCPDCGHIMTIDVLQDEYFCHHCKFMKGQKHKEEIAGDKKVISFTIEGEIQRGLLNLIEGYIYDMDKKSEICSYMWSDSEKQIVKITDITIT